MAAHLLNRAGFGGPPAEIESLVALGPEKAVSHFVDYEKIDDDTADPDWAKPDPDRVEKFMAARRATEEERRRIVRQEQQSQRERMLELRQWWLRRMAAGRARCRKRWCCSGTVISRRAWKRCGKLT